MVADEANITVVIVEDHVALRRGLEMLLRSSECRVIGTADGAAAAEPLIERRRPGVAIIDINLPDGSGVDLTRRLLERIPDLGVLLYTGVEDREVLGEALDCGARGFAMKAGAPEELLQAIRAVARGDSYVDPRLRPLLLARFTTDRIGVLSPREREVLDLLAQGLTGEQAATQLSLSPETIRTHVRNAMDKLEANTRVHAVAIALRQGEI
ncbi:MAG: response regulator transcription factor [Actinobacteria bacterium]|nr:response regulator transcription factor [Actinomycetota bacterium]